MADSAPTRILYKRSRFTTRLPADRLYSPSHFWMMEVESGLWRVGFTKFATRMLGDLVEHGFGVKVADDVTLGQAIGWVEGFKALTDVYCVLEGKFDGSNAALQQDITLVDADPYERGWLYAVRGTPDPNATDVQGYVSLLDVTIDKMQSQAAEAPEDCEQ